MIYVSELVSDEFITLENAYKEHPKPRVRSRSHIIILSNKGYQLQRIADICGVTRQTVSNTIKRWEEHGFLGLYDNPRPGKPPLLSPEDKDFVYEMIEEEPRSVKKIIDIVEDQCAKRVSASTIRRVIKKN